MLKNIETDTEKIMEIILKKRIDYSTSLFSGDLPFQPYDYRFMYIETYKNTAINSFFQNHNELIANSFGKSLFYMPAIMERIMQMVEYNWPGTDLVLIEKVNPDTTWYQEIYREILSYRIVEAEDTLELPLQIAELPFLMRYEYTTSEGYLFTLFPLHYDDDEQFEELLKDIVSVPYQDSGIRYSTLDETFVPEDSRDRADNGDIGRLADEIKQRIQALRLMGVSEFVIKRLIDLPEPKLSKLHITKDYRIFLPDYNGMEITMPTLSKVVYFFYLRHLDGLRFKELIDYKDELLEIYYRISNRDDIEKMEQSIDELVDSTRNSINEKCSRIRASFVCRFSDDLAKNYYITVGNGNVKRITLDRCLLIDETGLMGRNCNTKDKSV